MTGEEPMKSGPRKLGDVAQFRVKNAPAGSSETTVRIAAHAPTAVEEVVEELSASEEVRAATESAPVAAPASAAEPEIDFPETEKPAKVAPVKHVKVRSTIDVMAELEALRKRATTQTSPKSKKEGSPRRGREVQRTAEIRVPGNVLPQAKSLKVTLSFEENGGGVVHQHEQTVDLGDASDADSLSVHLKIDQT